MPFFSFNPLTINTMETGSQVAHVSRLASSTCSPRLTTLGQQLEPLLPGKFPKTFYIFKTHSKVFSTIIVKTIFVVGKDNKRKRLNAVLDKLTSNINKCSDDGAVDDPDSPDKNLEFAINVKTKIKKESSEEGSGDSDDATDNPVDTSLSSQDSSPKPSSAVHSSPTKHINTPFYNHLLLNSPKCDRKSVESKPQSPILPPQITSYEEYVLKSHLLSKMYLQQYCGGLQLTPATPDINTKPTEKPKRNGEATKRKENGSLLDSPLDLTTSKSPDSQENHSQTIQERLYPQNFPFASLQQMLIQSNMNKDTPTNGSSKPSSKSDSKTTKLSKPAPTSPSPDTGKDLASYPCPICGQIFSLHDR